MPKQMVAARVDRKRLTKLAKDRGTTESEVIRRAIDGMDGSKTPESKPYRWNLRDFRRFCKKCDLKLEPFQILILGFFFAGCREILVLIPRGNGKTTLFAALAVFHLLSVEKPMVYVAAASRDQARVTYDQAVMLVMEGGFDDVIEIRWNELRVHDGRFKCLASDAPKAHGLIGTLFLVDELHAHKNDQLYIAIKTAMGKNPNAQMGVISTAGYDPESTLGRLRQKALEMPDVNHDGGTLTIAQDPDSGFVMVAWELPEGADINDAKVLKTANPASFVSVEFLKEQIHSPGLPESERARYHGNVWTASKDAWLPHGAWDACNTGETIPEGAEVTLGVDIGLKYDSSAVVALHEKEDGAIAQLIEVFEPEGDGTPLDLGDVENCIRQTSKKFKVTGVVYDPWKFERSAQTLSDEGFLMIEFPMSNSRTSPASSKLYEAVISKEISHNGDKQFALHVAAGSTKDTDRGWRLYKNPKLKRPIDALIALLIAYSQIGEAMVYERRELLVV